MKISPVKHLVLILLLFSIAGCATYYMKTIEFHDAVSRGDFKSADEWLNQDKKGKRKKNRLLHTLNRGYVARMLDDYDRSIAYFADADIQIEDYHKNVGAEALALVSNPTVKPYKPEDFEVVMVSYYQAMNYLAQNKLDEALVECRKMDIKLKKLNDKYKDHKNRYQRDAFGHLTMGLIYDANKDYNNAFIAYRNAYEVYKSDYSKNFGLAAPLQLKKDILRTAALSGFWDEVDFYQREFGMKYVKQPAPSGELVFFWENGFGPVKAEWSVNLAATPQGSFLVLDNPELGLFFTVPVPLGVFGSNDLDVLRIAFPKYVERRPVFSSGSLSNADTTVSLELAENINEIAFKCLHDRMAREVANSVARLVSKKVIEYSVKRQSEFLGFLTGIAGVSVEKADTRNWQTLPHDVSYCRIPLKEGVNKVSFTCKGSGRGHSDHFTFTGRKGKTIFHAYHVLDSYPPQY